jgi:hypothetical protein
MEWGNIAVAGVVLLAAADARAQSPAPTALAPLPAPGPTPASASGPVIPVAPVAPSPGAPTWSDDYLAARERLLAGDFDDAAERFEALAARATDDSQRVLAQAMRDVARSYASRELKLVRRAGSTESEASAPSPTERSTDEIAQLYLNTLTYGVGTGLWIDAHTQASSAAGVILPMLALTGGAVATVAALDIGHPLRYGVPQSAVSGLYLGLEEGILLSLWNELQDDSSTHWSGTTVADVIWVTSTLGLVGGGLIGATQGTTPGRASFVGSTGLWAGTIVGLVATAATDSSNGSTALLAADIGLNLGILSGIVAAGPVSPSIARVRFLDLGGIAGGLLVGGLYLAAADQHSNGGAAAASVALGCAAGLGVAWWATRNIPADRPGESAQSTALRWEPSLLPLPSGAAIGVHGTM